MMSLFVVLACSAFACALVAPSRSGLPTRRVSHRPGCGPRRRELAAIPPGVGDIFDPSTFVPLCRASDTLYRSAQGGVLFVIGEDVYTEYAPLIAGGLLRVRLELCVVESFITEAIIPFVEQKGLSWVLPQHETVETFLAGSIFALATNFILIGSTKIVAVIVTYFDFFLGMPTRFLANQLWQRTVATDEDANDADLIKGALSALTSPASIGLLALAIVRLFAESLKLTRQLVEFADLFVGRYLALATAAYITVKFLHFRVFL